jgi:2,3-dihydroxybiphenyl 1,2-dioxygenase
MRGVDQLGYIGFEVSDLDAWESFAVDVLGLELAGRTPTGGLSLRHDAYRQRIVVERGDADDLAVLGWQVADRAALDEIAGRLETAGVAVTGGTADQAAARCADRLVKLIDPAGNPTELFCGPAMAGAPPSLPLVRSGFVAGEQGLGHAVITARNQAESAAFYTELLGFRLSDHIRCELYGYKVDIAFFHANARHHSLAFGGAQQNRIHHFMLQVGSLDDVGLCYDRALRSGVRIAQTLGRHPNDRMFSFYAHTPSGFQFEYGWGAREVDDTTWKPGAYDHISEWGHHPPALLSRKRGPK